MGQPAKSLMKLTNTQMCWQALTCNISNPQKIIVNRTQWAVVILLLFLMPHNEIGNKSVENNM